MYTRKIRQCSNCLRMVEARNHAAEFICDDCRAVQDEREAREAQWRKDLREVNAEIRHNWRAMKKLQIETWGAV